MARIVVLPLLAPLPIAFLLAALLADLAFAATLEPACAEAALALIVAALAASVLVTTSRALEACALGGRAGRIAGGQLCGGLAGLLLVVVDLLMRLSAPEAPILPFGPILSVAAAAVFHFTGGAPSQALPPLPRRAAVRLALHNR